MFWILTKLKHKHGGEESRIIPFRFNLVQTDVEAHLGKNNRILKGRQGGYTTWAILRRLLLPVITEPGKTGMLISQNSKYVQEHFQMARRAHRLIAAEDPMDDSKNTLCKSLKANALHTIYSNRRELVFDQLDSKLIVESAEVGEAAQGVTLHHGVGSEVSRWPGNPEETISNIKGAIVPGGTWDEECTANNAAGYFYEQCLRCMNNPETADATFHYHSWWWTEDYEMALSEKEKDELEKDLTEEELAVIHQMHKELEPVAWPKVA